MQTRKAGSVMHCWNEKSRVQQTKKVATAMQDPQMFNDDIIFTRNSPSLFAAFAPAFSTVGSLAAVHFEPATTF